MIIVLRTFMGNSLPLEAAQCVLRCVRERVRPYTPVKSVFEAAVPHDILLTRRAFGVITLV